ncbi:MAG TPA: hypothetical protein VH593_03965 [Ktedonobacteraceae bacterium]
MNESWFRRYVLLAFRIDKVLAYLQRPFREGYIFTYTAGADLMRPWLQGADRHTVFARFLIEPITPSDLRSISPGP